MTRHAPRKIAWKSWSPSRTSSFSATCHWERAWEKNMGKGGKRNKILGEFWLDIQYMIGFERENAFDYSRCMYMFLLCISLYLVSGGKVLQAGQKDWTPLRQFASLPIWMAPCDPHVGSSYPKKMKVMLAAHVLVYEVAHFVIKIYFHPFHPSELDHFFGCTIPCFLQGIQTEMAQKLPRWVRRFAHPPDGGFLPAGFGSRGRLGLLLAQARADAVGWSKLSHGRHRRHATGWWTSTMPRSSGCASRSRKTWCDSRSLSLWRVWVRQGWHERLPKDWVYIIPWFTEYGMYVCIYIYIVCVCILCVRVNPHVLQDNYPRWAMLWVS